MTIDNLSGKRFGRLVALEYQGNYRWKCICDCGKNKIVTTNHLKSGFVKSCGCLRREGPHKTHQHSKTRLYRIWRNMKSRCYNPKSSGYKCYGGRGITICNEWLMDFKNFYDWAVENKYADDLSIDRIDVSGNYEPSNCRWSTRHIQSVNKTNNVYVTYEGKKLTVSEAATALGISPYTLYSRLKKLNWNMEDTLNTIPGHKGKIVQREVKS